jgi:hypothetical protein
MKKPKVIFLNDSEQIIAVVPSSAYGPGWANTPTWVYIMDYVHNKFREECIQPEERTDALNTLCSAGMAICNDLKDAIPVKREQVPK